MAYKNETEKLVKAVFANRVKEVKQIMDVGNFDPAVLNDAFKALNITDYSVSPIPLFYVSLCNYIYLSGDDWEESFKSSVNRNLNDCKELIAYWAELGYDVTTPIDFSRYADLVAFYTCYEFEDLLDGTEEQLVAMGYDKEEARLCYAIASYDQETIYHLLEKNVNSDVWISGDWTPAESEENEDGANGLRFILDATSSDPMIDGFLDYYSTEPVERLPKPTSLMFHDLFMVAAYQQIYEMYQHH